MDSRNIIKNKNIIPDYVISALKTLDNKGFEAFLVGGCVRDLLINRQPKDWDITTSANPDQIMALFEDSYYENDFGTVGVKTDGLKDILEITPYRTEGLYSDKRRPDNVTFGDSIEEDLKRRDFTINAIAYNPLKDIVVDPYIGIKDIDKKTLKAVGIAKERFNEDGLRIMRAVRFCAELGFTMDSDTEKDLIDSHETLKYIAKERIRDEFVKIIMSSNPMIGLFMAQRYDLIKYIVPELEDALHVKQNQAHSYEVFEHLLRSLQCSADKGYKLEIRLAALFHDIGKPKSRRFSKEKNDYTFYGHEVIGAQMTKKILERLHFSKKTIEMTVKLVRWHMFFSDTEQISLSAVRRMIVNVGKENIWDLMNLRICDRVGTGRPKENPYRLRKYNAMIEQVLMDPIDVGMLKIDGNILIKEVGIEAGRKIGLILKALLEEVIEDPTKNTLEYLKERAEQLNKIDMEFLVKLAEKGEELRKNKENEQLEAINKRHHLKHNKNTI
jgi:tRNA nucleotidyltransferase (CCA-adding enzyme)